MPHLRRRATSRGGRGRRLLRWIGLLLLLGVLSLAWTGWQAVQGARSLQAAADGVRTVQGDLGGPGNVAQRLGAIAEQTGKARRHLEDPLVRVAARAPRLGDPLAAVLAVARAADTTIAEAVLPLVTAAGKDPAARLTAGPGAVDVDFLSSLAQPAAAAADRLDTANDLLQEAPSTTYLTQLDMAVGTFAEELTDLRTTVTDVALALEVAPELLGQDRLRRYLVISQTPAEPRGTGGLIGGYSLLEVTDGVMKVVNSAPKSELQSPGEPVEYISQEFDEHYDVNGATTGWVNSNLSPHFPYAARIWMKLWEQQHGEQLDGALLLDPIALSYLMQATGPVPLPDGGQATAQNVVDLTLRDVYARIPGPEQDAYLQGISEAVAQAVTTREIGGRALVDALLKGVEERRLLLWSADERVQTKLDDQPISGTLPEGRRAVGDVIVDAAGSKLGYYLERDLRYTQGCGQASELTLRLTNAAPASGLTNSVTPDDFRRGEPPGTNIMLTTLYLPAESQVAGVTLGGQELFFRQGTERGLVWIEVLVTLLPGDSKDLVVTFNEPEGSAGPVKWVKQPLVREETFTAVPC